MFILKRRKKKKSPLLSTIKTNSVLIFGVEGDYFLSGYFPPLSLTIFA